MTAIRWLATAAFTVAVIVSGARVVRTWWLGGDDHGIYDDDP